MSSGPDTLYFLECRILPLQLSHRIPLKASMISSSIFPIYDLVCQILYTKLIYELPFLYSSTLTLEQKDILQVNAIIIAGALIFLTLFSITSSKATEILNQNYAISLGLIIIFTFGISSAAALKEKNKKAIDIMIIGFYILIASSLILFVNNIVRHVIESVENIPTWFDSTKQEPQNENLSNRLNGTFI